MQIDVIKLGSHVLQVLGKTGLPAAVMPYRSHLVAGVCKDRAEAIVDIHLLTILALDLINPGLGDRGPDAKHVGETCQGNFFLQSVEPA